MLRKGVDIDRKGNERECWQGVMRGGADRAC